MTAYATPIVDATESTLLALKDEIAGLIASGALKVAIQNSSLAVTGPIAVSNFPATQPVSAISLPLPTGAATAANQATSNSTLANLATLLAGGLPGALVGGRLDVNVGASALPTGAATSARQDSIIAALASVVVTGPLTDTQLRASAVPVSGTFWQTTQPVSVATLPSALGRTTMSGSLSVTVASDQTVDVNLATALSSGIDSVTAVVAGLPTSLGQKTSAASTSIAIASDQAAIPIGDLATGAADTGTVKGSKVQGVYRTTPTAVADGQRVDAWYGIRGETIIAGLGISAVDGGTSMIQPRSYSGNTVAPLQATAELWTGAAWALPRTPNTFKTRADGSITAGTAVSIWAPASGKKPRVMGISLSAAVAGQIILKSGASAGAAVEFMRSPQLAAGGTWNPVGLGNGFIAGTNNDNIYVDVTSTGNVGGSVWGTEE